MIEAVHAILTDESVREEDIIREQLAQTVSAGAPWWNEQDVDE